MLDSPSPAPALIRSRLAIPNDARLRYRIADGWRLGYPRFVEWSDCDAFRHANHTAFLLWFETARNLYLEAMGLPRHSMDAPGPVMAQLEVRYLKPLAYHDPVFVTARTVSMRRTSFVMEYGAWSDGLSASATARLVLVVNATGGKAPIPEDVRAAIRAVDAPEEA